MAIEALQWTKAGPVHYMDISHLISVFVWFFFFFILLSNMLPRIYIYMHVYLCSKRALRPSGSISHACRGWPVHLVSSREMTEYQFGRALCDMYDVLTTTQSGLPRLPPKVQPAQSSFMSMGDEWGLGYSDLGSVYNYLCRGKHLVILEEWRHLVPRR